MFSEPPRRTTGRPAGPRPASLRTRVLTAVCLAALVANGAATVGSGARGAQPRPEVLGFQSEGSPPRLIDRSRRALTQVGVDGINLIGRGEVSAVDHAAAAQLSRARADGLPAVLLVGNWSPRINDFSEALAHRTLGSAAATRAAALAVAREAIGGGWNGVSVDLESLAPRDRAGLTSFAATLRGALPSGDSLTVCVEAFTSMASYRANGYDPGALARSADQIVLMTYDDHGPWENTPGPIGPLRWQRRSVRALERSVPREQILLGAADYGYAWRPHSNDNLNVAQARALVARRHSHARWVAAVGEWTAGLPDGSTLWWSDRRSVALRIRLAQRLGLHGVAVWSLGTGDPIPAG